MIKHIDVKIAKTTFRISQLNAYDSNALAFQLIHLAGKNGDNIAQSLRGILTSALKDGEEVNQEEMLNNLFSGILTIFGANDPQTLHNVCDDVIDKMVKVVEQGVPIDVDIDLHVGNNVKAYFSLVIECLKHNYAGVFTAGE